MATRDFQFFENSFSIFDWLISNMNPQYRDAFIQGFGSIFRQWTALELAVHNGWGGPQSAEKANQLMDEVLAIFDDPKRIYKDVRDK